jgi:tetratricopeptide (TPR) repeat protein
VSARVRELMSDPDWCDRPDAFDVLVKALQFSLPEAVDFLRDLRDQPEAVQRLFRQPWPMPSGPVAALPLLVYALTLSVVSDGKVPAEIADLAAERAEWAVKHVRTGSWDDDENVAEARFVLAVARLRQGRPEEAERLCAKALRPELDPDDRATVLATVAMARHARLLSGREQLDEALRLDPDAAMVSEAARFLDDQDAAVKAYERRQEGPGQSSSVIPS